MADVAPARSCRAALSALSRVSVALALRVRRRHCMLCMLYTALYPAPPPVLLYERMDGDLAAHSGADPTACWGYLGGRARRGR